MLSLTDGIKHLYLYKINEVDHRLSIGLNNWIAKGSDYLVVKDQTSNCFSICTYDYFDFLRPYAFDINRLSCASIESIKDIEKKTWQSKFIGWNITKFYYSAFFSAHCILKLTGNSLVNIDSIALDKIRSITRNYGFTYGNLNSGIYCVQIDFRNNNLAFFKNPVYDNSHEGLWRCFLDFLNSNKSSIYSQLPLIEAQPIVEKIEELIKALKNWNCSNGNWLSRVRNLVNYNQSYGIWFPYKDYLLDYDLIYDFLDLHLSNPLSIDIKSYEGKDLLYFVRTCQLINSIALEMLNDIENKNPSNKSFVKAGIKQFQNLYA